MDEASKTLTNLSAEAKRALLAKILRDKAKANESWTSISHNQKALWFLSRLAPDSAAYNLLYAARINAQLDRNALQKALHTLCQRYPILTATFAMHDGEPAQKLATNRQLVIEEINATTWSLDYLQQQLLEESNQPINLEQGPILRVQLYQRSSSDYVLALIAHHIAVDFWALDILVDELYILYAAEEAGIQAPLPAPGPQHTEYVRWQQNMLASAEGESHWNYWQRTLSGELPILNLPTDRSRPPMQTYKGASHSFSLSSDLARRLRTLANEERVTLFTLMLTAYQALLFRYTNQEDIIVGTPALGRTKAEWERVVDYLANPVLVRANLSSDPTFKTLLQETRQGVLDALEHQDYPFPLLVERLHPKRDPSYSPIYQTLFIWDRPRTRNDQDLEHLGLPELARHIARSGMVFEPFAYGQQGAPFDLTLTIFEIEGELSADFRYNVDLFTDETIARLEQHFRTLLNSIVDNPQQRILELPLLTIEERRKVLIDWNATWSSYPSQNTLHQLVEAQVEQTPDETAVIFEGQNRTYRELNNAANNLATHLQSLGVGPDVLVGVSMERSFDMVVSLLAILKAGGAYVPLDPTYPSERLSYMLQDSQVAVLLTQPHIKERLPRTDAYMFCPELDWQTTRDNLPNATRPENLAYMIYTSGSTGKPKGVMNTHRGISNRLHWMQQSYQLTTQDRVMQKTPFSFDVSVWEFFWTLITGAGLVVARPGGQQDPTYLAGLIKEQHVTTMHFVPSMLQVFLLETDLETRAQSLRQVICSGEALTPEHIEQFFMRFPQDVKLYNLYGPTEAAIDVTAWECTPSDKGNIPIGRPIANTQIYILNSAMQPVPAGHVGELYIGGVGVARGYYNRPELTAEKFIRDPFSSQLNARLFKTGDLARYRADGAIEFLGRIDHQVKLRGFRIELGEIETTVKQHPAIKEAIVIAREDTPGNKRLVAYLVPVQVGIQPSIEELRGFLKEQLPDYMIPAVFMYLEVLPLAPNGKVDRKTLPIPDSARPELEVAYVAPRTATETSMAEIWAQVLNMPKVGIHDNYFDLGGASIQSLDIVSKANAIGLPMALEMLFEFQTIAELSAAIDAKKAQPQNPTENLSKQQVENLAVPQTEHRLNNRTSSRSSIQFRQFQEPKTASSRTESPATTTSKNSTAVAEVLNIVDVPDVDLGNTMIESLGTYLPAKIVTSEEIIANCVRPIRFPLARLTGIKTRRVVGENEYSIDLAIKAIENCLANSKYNREDIDLIVCGNISRFHQKLQFSFEPNTAIQLKQHFGFDNAIALDVSNACTGLFTAAYVIDSFIKAGLIRRGIAVSGEYITHLIDTAQKEIESFMDSRLACLTVGDAGAAMLIERAPSQKVGFHDFEMYSLGRYSEACIGKATDQPHGGAIMYTDAVTVSAVNMKQAVSHAALVIERSKWPKDAFQHIIVHQTSKTTINDVGREINSYFGEEIVKQENVINNITERANTATTTHMIAVMDNIRSNRIQSGDNAIFGITGSGATIGTALYTFDDLPDRIRRREAGEYTPEKVISDGKYTPRLPANQRIRIESVGTIPANTQVEKLTLDLIEAAAKQNFQNSTYDKSTVDLLIYSGVYRDEFISEPAIAALVEGRLGINDDIETQQDKKTFAFDLINGGIGTLNACYVSIGMIRSRKAKTAMIVASEIENNREVAPDELVGIEETGSTLLLDASPDGKTGFGNFVFKSFTDYMEDLRAHTVVRDGKMVLQVEQVAQIEEHYLRSIQDAVAELLEIEQLDLSQINVILPPQISSSFISKLSTTLQVDHDKFVDVQTTRDLFTSSLAYSLQYAQDHHKAKPGDIGLIINVGSGLQVGCATYYF